MAGSKVLEYIIGAKDATANAVNSALNRVKTYVREATSSTKKQEEATKGAERAQRAHNKQVEYYLDLLKKKHQLENSGGGTASAATGISKMAATAKQALPAITAVTASVGMMEGAAGKVAQGISGIAAMTMAFGPLGAVIGATQVAIGAFAQHFKDKADELVRKTAEMKAKVEARWKALTDLKVGRLEQEVKRAAERVDELTESFERAAKAKRALDEANAATQSAKGQAELADMERRMTADMGAASDEDRGRVGAAWRLQIAEKQAEIAKQEAETRGRMERDALKTEEDRLALAKKNLETLSRTSESAYRKYHEAKENYGDFDPAYVARLKEQWEKASARSGAEAKRVRDLESMIGATRQNLVAHDIERNNAVTRAYTGVDDARNAYEQAERDYAAAREKEALEAVQAEEAARQQEIEQEERNRLDMERRISQQRVRMMQSELQERQRAESEAQARLSAATSAEQRAWGWYRNRDSWAAQLQDERDNADAEKRFAKEWESLQRKSNWRTAKLSDDEEIVRRVGLAREEKAAAEKYAQQTAEATERSAIALEALQQAIEGEE